MLSEPLVLQPLGQHIDEQPGLGRCHAARRQDGMDRHSWRLELFQHDFQSAGVQ